MTTQKVEILFVISSLAVGGAEGQLIKLISRLDRSKFRPIVALLAASNPGRVAQLDCDVESIGVAAGGYSSRIGTMLSAVLAVWRLRRLIKRHNPAVVHAFLPAPSIISAAALKLSGCSAPLIVSRRSLVGSYRKRSSFAGFIDEVCTRRFATLAIGNSREVTRELVEIDKVSPERALTIYNGVDVSEFERNATNLLPRPSAEIVFCMVGNFRRQKGHLDFVRVASEISQGGRDCAFMLLGEDQGTLDETLDAVVREQLTTKFHILPSSFSPRNVYATADIYLCTSESEGFSNVILEAMASGLPVIAFNVGGNSEAVIDGETGYIVSPGDITGFVEKALSLVADRELRMKMGHLGKQRARAKFGVGDMVSSYEDVYTKYSFPPTPRAARLAHKSQSV